jgi:nucleoside phosphorylase
MLIWICALHCEAKPVIDRYRLKKSHDESAFDVYYGDGMACVVSGIGKVASAAASAWVAALHANEAALGWINLGVAGAAEHDIGELFLLDKIVDGDSGQAFYPVPVSASAQRGGTCLTLNRPGQDYREDVLFDMEASGFMQSALRFSSAELIQVLKVISDNRQRQTGLDRRRVSELIAKNIEAIAGQANGLIRLKNETAALESPAASWQRLLELAHFTRTQKNRLRVLWRYLGNRDLAGEDLLMQLASNRSAAAIIQTLERISQQDGEGL